MARMFAVDVNRPLIELRVNTAKTICVLIYGVKWGNCVVVQNQCPLSSVFLLQTGIVSLLVSWHFDLKFDLVWFELN